MKKDFRKKLKKAAQKGDRGFPVATIAYYGPDDKRASKVAVGIILHEGAGPETLERWFSDTSDVRYDASINKEIYTFIRDHKAVSVVITDGIIGCPHEEGIDYPHNETCPCCPFWANRDRFTGQIIQ